MPLEAKINIVLIMDLFNFKSGMNGMEFKSLDVTVTGFKNLLGVRQ